MAKDPTRIQFGQELRKLLDDPEAEGLNCVGCLFKDQRAAVCVAASEVALQRGLRDCDAVDQFGDVVIYVSTNVDPRQLDILGSDEHE